MPFNILNTVNAFIQVLYFVVLYVNFLKTECLMYKMYKKALFLGPFTFIYKWKAQQVWNVQWMKKKQHWSID